MSWPNVVSFFLCIFYSIFFVIFICGLFVASSVRANNLYAQYVIRACQDVIELHLGEQENLSDDKTMVGKNTFWEKKQDRESAVNAFYTSLGLSLNKNESSYYNEIERMTPVICLVDYDGYYISYNTALDDKAIVNEDYENLHNITELQTWAETIGTYVVRYYLTDDVMVMTGAGKQYKGNRKAVYKQILTETSDTTLSYLADDEEFELSRNACVIQQIDDQIEYYINNINNAASTYGTQYVLNMAENPGETWAGMIDGPTVLAFVQGKTMNLKQRNISVFSFGAYDIDESLHYFIVQTEEGERYYYCYEEELEKGNILFHNNLRIYNNTVIKKLYSSAKECAKLGSYPPVE